MYSSILMSNSSRHVLINHLSSALEYFDATLHVPINFTNHWVISPLQDKKVSLRNLESQLMITEQHPYTPKMPDQLVCPPYPLPSLVKRHDLVSACYRHKSRLPF